MERSHHISEQYNLELDKLRTQVLTMGGLVETQLLDAITALVDGDTQKAEPAIHADQAARRVDRHPGQLDGGDDR